jgi:rhodanese-related sulfurtransferase
LILDVRTPDEFAAGHIEGAVNIDWYNPQFKAEIAALDKSKPVFVYCAVGGRSGQAKKLLNSEGFKEVHNLNGGIEAWKKDGLKVVK